MLRAYLKSIHCNQETDEVGSDEPYVLVTAVNLASSISVQGFPVPLPAFDVTLYGPFDDFDKGETKQAPGISSSFWGINGAPAGLTDPEQAIFVVNMMENDDGNPGALRGIVKGVVGSSVLGSLTSNRPSKVAALIRDIDSASGTPTGAPNFDDKIGGPQELRFSGEELARADRADAVSRTMVMNGDGGSYNLEFEVLNDFGVFGAIGDKWADWRRGVGPLALPTSDELPTFDRVGRFRSFQGGTISWHPSIGAHMVIGAIGGRWLQIGREQFGYPITDETPTADGHGRFNHFRALQLANHPEASIFWSPETGAHEIFGAIRAKWLELGAERGLGYPLDAEQPQGNGRAQQFQRGRLFWTPQGGVVRQ